MLDHITFEVLDVAVSTRFYDVALAPLNVRRLVTLPAGDSSPVDVAAYGIDQPQLWIAQHDAATGHFHIALRADDRARVDAFYAAAMAAGGRDNGPPGVRPHYHQHYYGAFVLDPDGHNIEAVCHIAEP